MGAETAATQAATASTGVNPLQLAGTAVGLVGTLAEGITGATQRREALDLLKNYQRQELTNVAEGLGVSTLGADLRVREAQRSQAAAINALRGGGARTLIGGLPSVVRQGNVVAQQAAADLDRQQQEINRIRAQDEARIRNIQEAREIQDIAGLGQLAEVGTQNVFGALQSGAQGLFSLGNINQQNQFLNRLAAEYFGREQIPMVTAPTMELAPLNTYGIGDVSDFYAMRDQPVPVQTRGFASIGGVGSPTTNLAGM